jgi:hypothetical protein
MAWEYGPAAARMSTTDRRLLKIGWGTWDGEMGKNIGGKEDVDDNGFILLGDCIDWEEIQDSEQAMDEVTKRGCW